jgi:hypothetical protein
MSLRRRISLSDNLYKIKAKQSKEKQSKAKQSKAKQSKAKQSKAKQIKAKQSKAKQKKAKKSKALLRIDADAPFADAPGQGTLGEQACIAPTTGAHAIGTPATEAPHAGDAPAVTAAPHGADAPGLENPVPQYPLRQLQERTQQVHSQQMRHMRDTHHAVTAAPHGADAPGLGISVIIGEPVPIAPTAGAHAACTPATDAPHAGDAPAMTATPHVADARIKINKEKKI